MTIKLEGFHRKLYLTRYATKAFDKERFLKIGNTVVTLVKEGEYPVREVATVIGIEGSQVIMKLQSADGVEHQIGDIFVQDISYVDVLLETEWEQTADRVSKAIAKVDGGKGYEEFMDAISNFHLIPSGRILNGAGDDAEVTLFNCYVVGVDSAPWAIEKGRDSRQAIAYHQAKIEEIMARGGGVGTNLDVFRPRNASLSKTKGQSAGAVYIGNRFSGSTDFVNQGNRRGAQMLAMSCWHPDVYYTNDINSPDYNEDFIGAKRKKGFMIGNNSSVLISDAFMDAVEANGNWDLRFPDTTFEKYDAEWDGDIAKWEANGYPVVIYKTIKARDMWNKLMKCNHSSAEPGVLFIDRINNNHNGWYLGTVSCTNPCGEQPILPNSTCNLSAINFGRMLKVIGEDELGLVYDIDWCLLRKTIRTGVRFLDNVIDASFYFDGVMEEWQKGERRVGLGGLGVADLFIALRLPYGSKDANDIFEVLMQFLCYESYKMSVELAKEKGSFPLFDKEKFLQGGFIQRLPKYIQDMIAEFGIRNLTLNTFAPTGTTGSMTPSVLDVNGSVSTGIEPHYAMKYNRTSTIGDTVQFAGVAKAFMERNPEVTTLPNYFIGAMDLKPIDHVIVQGIAQKYIDSAISKTVNAPKNYSVKQCEDVYLNLYKHGCKGGTIYRDGSRDTQVLSLNNTEVENEVAPVITEEKVKGKYDDWSCPSCGSKEHRMVEGCPLCLSCGGQSCSI